jgi:hypothetical protein
MGKRKGKLGWVRALWPFSADAGWSTAVSIGLAAAVVGGLAFGADKLMARARQVRTIEAPSVVINFPKVTDGRGAPTDLLPPEIRNDIETLALRNLSGDPLDHASLGRMAQRLMLTGWFRSIERIERRPNGQVVVLGEWRVPVAVVRELDTDRLVTARGELLPIMYPAGASGLPVIVNPSQPAPIKNGEMWAGGDVQAGLALLALLSRHEPTFVGPNQQVVGVDVGLYNTPRQQLQIVTSSNARVIWGGHPEKSNAAEASNETKLARLQAMRSSPAYGKRIDAGRRRIDISLPAGITTDTAGDVAAPPVAPAPLPNGRPNGPDGRASPEPSGDGAGRDVARR